MNNLEAINENQQGKQECTALAADKEAVKNDIAVSNETADATRIYETLVRTVLAQDKSAEKDEIATSYETNQADTDDETPATGMPEERTTLSNDVSSVQDDIAYSNDNLPCVIDATRTYETKVRTALVPNISSTKGDITISIEINPPGMIHAARTSEILERTSLLEDVSTMKDEIAMSEEKTVNAVDPVCAGETIDEHQDETLERTSLAQNIPDAKKEQESHIFKKKTEKEHSEDRINGRGLFHYKKFWFRRNVDINVDGHVITGIPILSDYNIIHVINDHNSYFIPIEKIDYICTSNGLKIKKESECNESSLEPKITKQCSKVDDRD